MARVDSPQQRAALARTVIDLADSGVIDNAIADTAIVGMSLLHPLSVSVGANRTSSRLLVVSR
jgi:hypothetical protein